tara:strand:+ start:227 stop:517 length:291 start_codon:yes stop_codon:yes gene_type:complete
VGNAQRKLDHSIVFAKNVELRSSARKSKQEKLQKKAPRGVLKKLLKKTQTCKLLAMPLHKRNKKLENEPLSNEELRKELAKKMMLDDVSTNLKQNV